MRFLLGLALLASSCSPVASAVGAMALYDPSPSRPDFFAMPWPSDARLTTGADGKKHLDLTGFHDPGPATLVHSYFQVISSEPLDGFGVQSAIYFRFDAPIDPTTLPQTPADSIAAAPTVFVVGTTPGSPDYGRRVPVRIHFKHYGPKDDNSLYIGNDWLALLPEFGFPLREKTTYAAVITDGVRAADGGPVRSDPRFPGLPAALPLSLAPGQQVVSGTVFTTGDFTSTMRDLRAAALAQPAPVVSNLRYDGLDKDHVYDEYEGTYTSANFQEGDPPYQVPGSGILHRDANGMIAPARTENLRFAMTIPHDTMPDAGWPIVIYAHGSGGDYTTFIDDGSAFHSALVHDQNGAVLTKLAMISIDQVLNGIRAPAGTDNELAFYNFQNPRAGWANPKQGGIDHVQLLRLVEQMNLASAPSTGYPIKFDLDHVYFFGHSQGSQTGPLFLAFEPRIKAAVLSGAGASLILAILDKKKPSNLLADVQLLVNETVDEFHPMLSLIQAYMDSNDPANYARFFFREPPAGMAAKSIYQSMGLIDTYTPIPTIKALALSMAVDAVKPELEPIDDLPLRSLGWGTPPVAGNVANGTATGVLCEYKVPINQAGQQAYDGHFVVMNHPAAILQANGFLGTHVVTGTAQLLPYLGAP